MNLNICSTHFINANEECMMFKLKWIPE